MTAHIDGNIYGVEDNNGNVSYIYRSQLCHQKRHVVSCAHVSDEKNHDRFSMQHFSTADLEWLEGYMKDELSNYIPEVKVTHIHIQSDNVGRHFKGSVAIEYFKSLVNDCCGATYCMYVYSFGDPGHGKGFFDGLGGA